MESQYNMRSPAVKRLMREAQELREPTEEYYAQPVEDNLFEWHFTVRGPPDSDFEGGIYHGRIVLPSEYPMKPPSIILLTPNGRFEINKKICLSISGYHPESWQPSWSIRTALLALIGFMPTHGNGAIGSLDYTREERKQLAKMSQTWSCKICGSVGQVLQKSENTHALRSSATKEERELASQICFKGEIEKNHASGRNEASDSNAPDESQSPPREGNSTDSEMRRRAVATAVASSSSSSLAQQQMESVGSASSNPWSTVLIVVLSLAIAALLLRRIFFL